MKTIQLPSGLEAEITHITGKEEELIRQASNQKRPDWLEPAILACTKSLNGAQPTYSDIIGLHVGDRLQLLLAIRQESLGDTVPCNFTCENVECKARNHFEININDVENKPLAGFGELTLSDERTAVYGKPTFRYQLELFKSSKKVEDGDINKLFLARGIHIGEKAATTELLNELALRDREMLFEAVTADPGGPDTKIEIPCAQCGTVFKGRVEQQLGFLFPKRAALVV